MFAEFDVNRTTASFKKIHVKFTLYLQVEFEEFEFPAEIFSNLWKNMLFCMRTSNAITFFNPLSYLRIHS